MNRTRAAILAALSMLTLSSTVARAEDGEDSGGYKKGRRNDVNGWCYECPNLPPDVVHGPCPCQINDPIIIH